MSIELIKVINKIRKVDKRVTKVQPDEAFSKAIEDLVAGLVKDFTYPEINSPIVRPCPYIVVPEPAPYRPPKGPGDPGEPYQERSALARGVRKLTKAINTNNKVFKSLSVIDGNLFKELQLDEVHYRIGMYLSTLITNLSKRREEIG